MKRKTLRLTAPQEAVDKQDSVQMVEIWTDGACWPNPGGPGAWAAIVKWQEHEKIVSGFIGSSTNNRMEITAALEGLRCLTKRCRVVVYSDSQYLVRTMQGNYRKKKNLDLWQELVAVASHHQVLWTWVRGHAGDAMNERADALCEAGLNRRGFTDRSGKYR